MHQTCAECLRLVKHHCVIKFLCILARGIITCQFCDAPHHTCIIAVHGNSCYAAGPPALDTCMQTAATLTLDNCRCWVGRFAFGRPVLLFDSFDVDVPTASAFDLLFGCQHRGVCQINGLRCASLDTLLCVPQYDNALGMAEMCAFASQFVGEPSVCGLKHLRIQRTGHLDCCQPAASSNTCPTMTPMGQQAPLPWLRTPLPYTSKCGGAYSAQRYAWLSSLPDDLAFSMWFSEQAPPSLDLGVPGVYGAAARAVRKESHGGRPRAPLIQMAGWWTHQPPTEVIMTPWNGPGPCPPNWTAAWALHVQQLVLRGRWELHQSGRWTYRQLR